MGYSPQSHSMVRVFPWLNLSVDFSSLIWLSTIKSVLNILICHAFCNPYQTLDHWECSQAWSFGLILKSKLDSRSSRVSSNISFYDQIQIRRVSTMKIKFIIIFSCYRVIKHTLNDRESCLGNNCSLRSPRRHTLDFQESNWRILFEFCRGSEWYSLGGGLQELGFGCHETLSWCLLHRHL